MDPKTSYQQEWAVLQHSYDQYEAYGLIIKIVSIILFTTAFTLNLSPYIATLVLLILWLQEGIWKTFQSRTEQRLLNIESKIAESDNQSSFQFYSEWETNRPTTLGLILAYIKQSLRPTVAFPYVILVAVNLFLIP